MSTPDAAVTSWAPPAQPPRTLGEFLARFPDDESCRRYLAQVRWRPPVSTTITIVFDSDNVAPAESSQGRSS